MKVIVDSKIPFIREAIEKIADEVVYLNGCDFTPEAVHDADALIIRTRTKCNAQLLQDSHVRYIGTATIGFDHIDTDFLDKKGIVWRNCPGCNSPSVAQYIQSVLLLLEKKKGINLQQTTLGIVGAGHVGKAVGRVATRMGLHVIYNDPPLQESDPLGRVYHSLQDLQQQCDIISFHTPLVMQGKYPTWHLADREFLHHLKKNCILINTSRGSVVDNKELLAALREGLLADAVIDTWENEPQINLELLDRVFLGTPHIAGYSADSKANATRMVLEGFCDFFHIPADLHIQAPELPADRIPASDLPWKEKALAYYNPEDDCRRLRQAPETFEDLRGNYPLRREFF